MENDEVIVDSPNGAVDGFKEKILEGLGKQKICEDITNELFSAFCRYSIVLSSLFVINCLFSN